MPNLLNALTHRIADRRAILLRVLEALQRDRDCQYAFRSKITADEKANWEARNAVATLLLEFPKTAVAAPDSTSLELEP